jgi:hypothetical protein
LSRRTPEEPRRPELPLDRPGLLLDASLGPAHPITPLKATAMVERALEDATRTAAAAAIADLPWAARAARACPMLGLALRAALLVGGLSVGSYLVTSTLLTTRLLPWGAGPHEVMPSKAGAFTDEATAGHRIDPLAIANSLRRRGDWTEALAAYQRVIEQAETRGARMSPEAQAAALAAAALELEHMARPLAALQRYRVLMSDPLPDPLAEEARWGIVECHRRLGSRHDEAASLRDYLEAHPGGLLRTHAESRLAELELHHPSNTL